MATPRRSPAQLVSGNYYQALGVGTALGRPIQPSDDAQPGEGAVAVISDGLWARAFGRSPSVIGKTIGLNLTPVTIVGVNPPGLHRRGQRAKFPGCLCAAQHAASAAAQRQRISADRTKTCGGCRSWAAPSPEFPTRPRLAELSVNLDQAIRATLPVAERRSHADPHVALREPRNEPVGEKHGDADLCPVLAGGAGAAAGVREYRQSAAGALRGTAAGGERPHGAGREPRAVLRQVFTESLLLSMSGRRGWFFAWISGPQRDSAPDVELVGAAANSQPFRLENLCFHRGHFPIHRPSFRLAPALQSTRVSVNASLKDSAATDDQTAQGACRQGHRRLPDFAFDAAGGRRGSLCPDAAQPEQRRHRLSPRECSALPYPAAGLPLCLAEEHRASIRSKRSWRAFPACDRSTLSAEPLLANTCRTTISCRTVRRKSRNKEQQTVFNFVGDGFFSTMGIPIVARDAVSTSATRRPLLRSRWSIEALARKFFPKDESDWQDL